MSDDDQISETAKAVQEVAKTTGKAIDAGEKFGGFISRLISGPLEQGIGIFEDKLKYMRWERQVRLIHRAEQFLNEVGLDRPTRPIPMKFAIPLLEAASLEDDDSMQDIWARLLVNAANDSSGINLQRSYISILEQLTSLEALILQKIYSLTYTETQHKGVIVGMLPHDVFAGRDDGEQDHLPEPSNDVKLALANLARLGCIVIQKSWGGGDLFRIVNPTLLGKSFVEACTLQAR